MPWCYRACRVINEDSSEEWSVREFYTDETGEELGCSVNPSAPFGESCDDLKRDLHRMFVDVSQRPVVELRVFTCIECGDKDMYQQSPRDLCHECLIKK